MFITQPMEVAKEHTDPWAVVWGALDPNYQKDVVGYFKTLREASLEQAQEFANDINASAKNIRTALRIFSESTSIGCDALHLRRLANLPDKALVQLGMLFKQSIATLTVPMQDLLTHPSAIREEVGGIQNNCNHGVLLQGVHEILLPANPKLGCCHGPFLGLSPRRKFIAQSSCDASFKG